MKIANIRAPRFIKVVHWEHHIQSSLQTGNYKEAYDPRYIYDTPQKPKGSTWADWNSAADMADSLAANYYESFQKNQFQYLNLSQDVFLSLHRTAMSLSESDRAGIVRQGEVTGTAYFKHLAPQSVEVVNMLKEGYPSAYKKGNLVGWTSTACIEDLPESIQNNIGVGRSLNNDLVPRQNIPFKDEYGTSRQCGFYIYPPPNEIDPQLAAIQNDANERIRGLLNSSGNVSQQIDPIYIAARTQRWFVSIHPFNGGNGRTSRLIMDMILQSVGLPTPIIDNVDLDLTSTESHWAREVGKGIEKTLGLLEQCVDEPKALQCQTTR